MRWRYGVYGGSDGGNSEYGDWGWCTMMIRWWHYGDVIVRTDIDDVLETAEDVLCKLEIVRGTTVFVNCCQNLFQHQPVVRRYYDQNQHNNYPNIIRQRSSYLIISLEIGQALAKVLDHTVVTHKP